MGDLSNHFSKAASLSRWQRRYNRAFDKMASEIYFSSEAESIEPQNVEKTKHAFSKFLNGMGWTEAEWCFQDLLGEKTHEFAYRADGKTPNWYHEFRQCLYFLAMVRNGALKENDLRKYGGCEAAMGIILRHDSWEDLGKDRVAIFTALERRIYTQKNIQTLTDGQLFTMLQKAAKIVNGVDYLTRKIPVRDEENDYERKTNGKFIKKDRFGYQINLYYKHILKSPLTALSKFLDGIEGMSTRIGVLHITVEEDRKYTAERRAIYGSGKFDKKAIRKYPFLEDAIVSADSMLGIVLTGMETVNYYNADNGQNPAYAEPLGIDDYVKKPQKAFMKVPPAFHPVSIQIERLRAKALREKDGHIDTLIKTVFIPALAPHFPQITIYKTPVTDTSQAVLPAQPLSAPTMG